VQAEKKFDFLTFEYELCEFHLAVATRAFERIAAPDLNHEITPQWAHE
jgi:hypothetical protein